MLVKGRIEEVDLPLEKVDVIISEWMVRCMYEYSFQDTVVGTKKKIALIHSISGMIL